MSKTLSSFLILLIAFTSCNSFIQSPDQAAEDFIKSIQNKDYRTTYLMFSEKHKATMDTNNSLAIFNFTNTYEPSAPIAATLQNCDKLIALLQENATFSYQKATTTATSGNYTMIVETYDLEVILKATVQELETNASVFDLLRYAEMEGEELYQFLEEEALKYIDRTDSIPRKITEIPFTVSHNGTGYVID